MLVGRLLGHPLALFWLLLVRVVEGGVRDVLLHVEVVFPVWNIAVQHVQCVGEYWVAEESKTNGEADALYNPVAGCKWYHDRDHSQNARDAESRGDQIEWWSRREKTILVLAVPIYVEGTNSLCELFVNVCDIADNTHRLVGTLRSL